MEGFADLTCLLKPCVYALKHRGQVVYVGRSRKALSRLYTHANAENARRKGYATMHYYHKLGFRFDEIWVRECGVKDAEQVEKEMIHKYMPKHNVNHKLAEPREPFTLMIRGAAVIVGGASAAKPRPNLPVIERREMRPYEPPPEPEYEPRMLSPPPPMRELAWFPVVERRI